MATTTTTDDGTRSRDDEIDTVLVYDATDDGDLRVERLTRTENPTGTHVRVRVGVADLAVLSAFDGDVPSIDLTGCDDRAAAFGKELVA